MSPGEYFEVKYGRQARLFLRACAVSKLEEALEEALRQRFDRPDGRAGRLMHMVVEKDGVGFGVLWNRRAAVIGVLTVCHGPVSQETIDAYKELF